MRGVGAVSANELKEMYFMVSNQKKFLTVGTSQSCITERLATRERHAKITPQKRNQNP